jgi:hypothetical protein
VESPSAGAVVLVPFPFSDLSSAKLRPAAVLAAAGRGDFILCQITSNPYADPAAVELTDAEFASGSLQRTSYARPGKLFTAHESDPCDRWNTEAAQRRRNSRRGGADSPGFPIGRRLAVWAAAR